MSGAADLDIFAADARTSLSGGACRRGSRPSGSKVRLKHIHHLLPVRDEGFKVLSVAISCFCVSISSCVSLVMAAT